MDLLTVKEVKNFELFDYVYPDLGDEFLPSWDKTNNLINVWNNDIDEWDTVAPVDC